MEFAYNNSYQSSIKMTLYEALYGRKCMTPLCETELSEYKLVGPDLMRQTKKISKSSRRGLRQQQIDKSHMQI